MNRCFLLLVTLMLSLLWSSSLTMAQNQSGAAGRWEGSIDMQFMKMGIIVNLFQKTDGTWAGTISIPSQGLNNSALSNISVNGSVVSFAMVGIPGDPVYKAKLSDDKRMLSGDITQASRTVAFKLERRTEAESAAKPMYGATPEKGLPGQGAEGSWQGTLDAGGGLRLVLKTKKASDESLTALLDSPDQGITDLVIDTATFKDKILQFEITRLNASYEGKLSQDGSEISGHWEQQGIQLPLIFKRLAQK